MFVKLDVNGGQLMDMMEFLVKLFTIGFEYGHSPQLIHDPWSQSKGLKVFTTVAEDDKSPGDLRSCECTCGRV
jgi:hypothetical protein